MTRTAVIAAALALAGACGSKSKAPAPAPACDLEPIPLRRPAPARIVAFGDVHGDLAAARAALRLAGAIDDRDQWIGSDDMLVVQTGDLLDRGDDEPEIVALFERLPMLWLLGNHELMNAAGDLRYVTPDGMADYGGRDARLAEFRPGGPEATRFAAHNVMAIVGDTLFVHGGVLPSHVDRGLDRINLETRCWLAGHADELPWIMLDETSPVWTRDLSLEPARCDLVEQTLARTGAKRIVVGHTPQMQGITSACDGKVWRVDTGMARYYGGPIQVLSIEGDDVRVLSAQNEPDTTTPPPSGAE